jgi:hypothetical protein
LRSRWATNRSVPPGRKIVPNPAARRHPIESTESAPPSNAVAIVRGEILVSEARASRVRIRALAIDTRFAGAPAQKFSSNPNVEGEAFWEHGSRFKQALKKFERPDCVRASYIWFGGDLSNAAERLFEEGAWSKGIQRGVIDTVIENFPLSTPYAGGPWPTI